MRVSLSLDGSDVDYALSAQLSSHSMVTRMCHLPLVFHHSFLLGPTEATVGQIKEFQKLFLAPGFLAFGISLIVISIVIVVYFIPRYGKTNMLWCIMVCSMIGGLSVSTTTGLGAAIVTSIYSHDNQVCRYLDA